MGTSALIAVSAFVISTACSAAPQHGHPLSGALGSAAPIASAQNQHKRHQTVQLDLQLGPTARYLTPAQIQAAVGNADAPLPTVEIDAPSGITESAVSAPIPFGIAGVAWGFRHPRQGWRLILPVIPS
jgi:hypothetical protein